MDTVSCTEIIRRLEIAKATTGKTAKLRTALEQRRFNNAPNPQVWELEALISACNRSLGLRVFMSTGMNLLLWPWQMHLKEGGTHTREVEPPQKVRAAFYSTIGTCLCMTTHCNAVTHAFLKNAESGHIPVLSPIIPKLNQSTEIFLASAVKTFGQLKEYCTEPSCLRENIICVQNGMIAYSQKHTTPRIAKCLRNATSKHYIAPDYA